MGNVVWPPNASTGGGTTLPDTLALADAATNTAPDGIVEQHTSSGTTAAGFGLTDAVELQSAGGTKRRVMTDVTTLTDPTDGAEFARRTISVMSGGSLVKVCGFGLSGTNTGIFSGDPAAGYGMISNGSVLQFLKGGTGYVQLDANGVTMIVGRFQEVSGTGTVTTNTLTLASANLSLVAGTPTINGIVTTGWQAGATAKFRVASGSTVVHASGAPGTGAVAILTPTAANITTTSTRIFAVTFDGTNWIVQG